MAKAPSDLVKAGTLTFGSDIEYPPQEFDPAQPEGFDVDLGAALARRLCLQAAFVNEVQSGLIAALNVHRFDAIISALTITDANRQTVDFVPYLNTGEAVAAKRSRGLNITALTQLCGLKVAVEDGSSEQYELLNTVQPACPAGKPVDIKVVAADADAFSALQRGLVDAHFTDDPVAFYDAKRDPSIEVAGSIFEASPEGIAVRKTDATMLAALQAAFAKLESDGSYAALLKRWNLSQDDIRRA